MQKKKKKNSAPGPSSIRYEGIGSLTEMEVANLAKVFTAA